MSKVNSKVFNWTIIIAVTLVLFVYFYQISTFSYKVWLLVIADNEKFQSPDFFSDQKETNVTTLLFLGDIMLGRNVEYLSLSKGIDYPTKYMVKVLPVAKAVIGNFESAMATNHFRTPSFATQFSTSQVLLPVLTKLGITHVSLANNHSFDYNVEGYKNTVSNLQAISVLPFGHPTQVASSSLAIIDGSTKVGIIALNTTFGELNMLAIQEQLTYLNSITDIQVAYIHWGEEYTSRHNIKQADLSEQLMAYGVDTIIGHHPHVVQDIDLVAGKPVFYSLGNFIFDQYFSQAVQEGYILSMKIFSPTKVKFLILPITSIGNLSQPRLMQTAEAEVFLSLLAEISNPSLQQAIQKNTLKFEFSLAH